MMNWNIKYKNSMIIKKKIHLVKTNKYEQHSNKLYPFRWEQQR